MTTPANPQTELLCHRCGNPLKPEHPAGFYSCPYCDTHCPKCDAEIRSVGLHIGFCDCQRWQWTLLKGENPDPAGYWQLEPESALGNAASEAYAAAYEILAAAASREAANALAAQICAAPDVQVYLELGHFDWAVAAARNAAQTASKTLAAGGACA